jgi:hypothetical protein
MRSSRWWTCLALVAPLLTSTLAAQQPLRGVSAGRVQLGSPFEDGPTGGAPPERGWQVEGFTQWTPDGVPVGLRAEASYHRLTVPTSTGDFARRDELGALGAALLWPQARADQGFEPFLIAGANVSLNRLGLGPAGSAAGATRWSWGPDWNAGVGFHEDLLGVRTGLEIRMHRAPFTGRARSGWVTVSIPLLWKAEPR